MNISSLKRLSIMFKPSNEVGFNKWMLPITGYIVFCTVAMYLIMIYKGF